MTVMFKFESVRPSTHLKKLRPATSQTYINTCTTAHEIPLDWGLWSCISCNGDMQPACIDEPISRTVLYRGLTNAAESVNGDVDLLCLGHLL